MADDPYKVLGVKRDASQDDISRAYRALAKKYHPDLNPGDKKAEEQFKKVSAANDIVGDPDKRAKFDRGEIDAEGHERQRGFYRQYADADAQGPFGPGSEHYSSDAGYADLEDIFGDLFRSGHRPGGARFRMRGADVNYELPVEFTEAVNGAKRRFTMPDGKTLELTIPAGVTEGQVLRMRGQGGPGREGGPAGDAFVAIRILPHDVLRRDGDDIHLELAVSLGEAVLGAKVESPTTTGPVTITVPAGSNTGTVLRLRGKGVRARGRTGDQLVTLKVVLPETPDDELRRFVAEWAPAHSYNPRQRRRGAR
jgi:DnaJ-class molecular chaperone